MLLPDPSPLPRKKKFKVNRSALFVAKENRDSTGTNLCFKQYKDVWVTLVGLYFPLLRNPIGRTVLNLNFQHLFTLFHSDSVLSLPTLFFLVSSGYALSNHCSSWHHSLLFLSPHMTLRLTILDSCFCPIESQHQPCHSDFNSYCLVLTQALHIEPKLMVSIDLTHNGSEFSKLILALKISVIYYHLPSHLRCHADLSTISSFSPQRLMQKSLFLPLYFHTPFYNPGKALHLPTPNFHPPTLPQQILWGLHEGI